MLIYNKNNFNNSRHDHMIVHKLDLQLPVQSVPITTEFVTSNPVHGEAYSMQHYLIKFVSDL
jgi:hypothetical protein